MSIRYCDGQLIRLYLGRLSLVFVLVTLYKIHMESSSGTLSISHFIALKILLYIHTSTNRHPQLFMYRSKIARSSISPGLQVSLYMSTSASQFGQATLDAFPFMYDPLPQRSESRLLLFLSHQT